MSSNFVIYYAGREGSSPIIDGLASHPRIKVSVFEHLDKRNLERFFTPNSIGHLLSSYFSGHVGSNGSKVTLDLSAKPDPNSIYGLKWRPWGNKRALISSLIENNVVVFNLMRRDILNHALSLYYTSEILPNLNDTDLSSFAGHPQFKLMRMSEEEKVEVRKTLKNIEFNVDLDKFLPVLTNVGRRRIENHEKFIAPAIKRGVQFKRIFYEDFCNDPQAFFGEMLDLMGLEYSDDVLNTKYTKVNSSNMRSQVTNMHDLERSDLVHSFLEEWQTFISN